jgi:DNA polymerase (family X)
MSIQKKNMLVSDQLMLMADLEALSPKGMWPAKAYKKAAETVRGLDIPIDTVGDLKSLSGVGVSISEKIMDIINTGTCPKLDALKLAHPAVLNSRELLVVPGVGAKTAVKLYKKGITTLLELSKACDDGTVTTGSIKRGVKLALKTQGRIPIYDALPVVTPILDVVRAMDVVDSAVFVGSIARGKETIKDVDIVVVSRDREAVINKFLEYGEELIRGEQKARIIVPINNRTSVQVDLLFTTHKSWGAATMYFTGSKEHNIAVRRRANDRGMTLNEHGLTRLSDGKLIAGTTQAGIYEALDLAYQPEELREGDTIYPLKKSARPPKLVSHEDIYSDWHMHTVWSRDARSTFLEMAVEAKRLGLKTIGVTDHTEVQYGWDPLKIDDRRLEAEAAAEATGLTIYAGCETGVNPDGTLDWSDEYLNKMDYVIASIHRQHSKNPVDRLIAAARHPKVKIIGHPTGRMLNRREIPDDDWDKLFEVCAEENVLVEINGPRLDLEPGLIRRAKAKGCKFVLSSDAHHVSHLPWMRYALMNARRAGLTVEDLEIPFED